MSEGTSEVYQSDEPLTVKCPKVRRSNVPTRVILQYQAIDAVLYVERLLRSYYCRTSTVR